MSTTNPELTNAAVELLRRLVGHDTTNPGGDEARLAAWLEERLSAYKPDVLEVVRFDADGPRAYVWAAWGTPSLVVNAHVDTVPRNHGWTGDPWILRVLDAADGPRAVGLGACDTKGAIAAFLAALDAAKAPPRNLGVLFSGDEERGTRCLDAFVKTPIAQGLVERGARVLVCEPTGCRAGTRHRGIVALRAGLHAEGGHSSRADFMPAPIAELARLAVAWDGYGRAQRRIGPDGFPGLCLNVAALDGGVAFNVIPNHATLTVSVRPPPGTRTSSVRAALASIARETIDEASLETLLDRPAFQTRDLVPFRAELGSVIDAPIDLGFWTEAAVLAGAGLDAVVWGPGEIAQAHAPDEWVALSQLGEAAETFARIIAQSAAQR